MRKIALFLFILSGLALKGCKKYEDGGTLKSAPKNILNTWTLNKVFRNDTEITDRCGLGAEANGYWCKQIFTFSEGGTGSFIWTNFLGMDTNGSITWSLLDDNGKLFISFYQSEDFDGVFEILKLTKNNLNLSATDGTTTIRLEFVS